MRLFDAACVSILLCGCETWTLTAQQAKKLDVYARTCYCIILGIVQSESHTTNEQLCASARARPISSIIRERQLSFIGHCLRMPNDEPANIYALYQPKPSTSHKRGASRRNYIDQISGYLCSDKQIKFTTEDIARYAKSRSDWRKCVAAPNQPDR
jgi:hypothetical protein